VLLAIDLQRPSIFGCLIMIFDGLNRPDRSDILAIWRMIDWIIAAFNSTTLPWFRTRNHPSKRPQCGIGESLINLFEGFSTEGRQHPK
jgi:hypothetical protein